LREPINQSHLAAVGGFTIFETKPGCIYPEYRKAAENAFSGYPVFSFEHPDWIVLYPEQWKFSERRRRRLVIKEVNPLAVRFLMEYKPRLIFLVRHPAAVALSYRKMGWWEANQGGWDQDACWKNHGAYQAEILHKSLAFLSGYTDLRVVCYEDLCAQPIHMFQELFQFAELEWGSDIEAIIRERSSEEDDSDPYTTSRHSQSMIHAWREKLAVGEIEDVREGFFLYELPWYQNEKDW
jgi:hypothetical protein